MNRKFCTCRLSGIQTGIRLAFLGVGIIMSQLQPGPVVASSWDQVVGAAKKEGWVAVAHGGNAGPAVRRLYSEGFRKQYPDIRVNLTVAGGRSIAPRILMERRVGKHLWDIYLGGTTTALNILMPAGVLESIWPALLLPEVTDKGKWFGGQLDFSDDAGKYNLTFAGRLIAPIVTNSKLVRASGFRSYWDLLDPKWRGRLVMQDPRSPGNGLAMATYWYFTPAIGKKFMHQLFTKQDVKVTRNSRQLLEWVARGDYPVGLAFSSSILEALKKQGLPYEIQTADKMKEGSYLTAGSASVGLVSNAPHANAAKVYINWLLSKDTQAQWSRASGNWSRRVDVPQDHLNPGIIPQVADIDKYQMNYKEKWVSERKEIQDFLRKIVK